MPMPQHVNPRNFRVKEIVYDLDGFSIAWGEGDDGELLLGMRWNGNEAEQGYPKTFGNPVWFHLPKELGFVVAERIRELTRVLPTGQK